MQRIFPLVAVLCFCPMFCRAEVLLELPFNGSLNGAQGEVPVEASGISFVPGLTAEPRFSRKATS
jgi:hypothetical protein